MHVLSLLGDYISELPETGLSACSLVCLFLVFIKLKTRKISHTHETLTLMI